MARLPEPFVPCEQKHELCFAFNFGKCVILKSTDFDRFCPFYKTRKEYHDGIKKYKREETENY